MRNIGSTIRSNPIKRSNTMKKIFTIATILILLTPPIMATELSVGVGAGSNYGGIVGIVSNIDVTSDMEAFAGIGYAGEIGYVFGGRYYISDSVRLIANYGTNSIIDKNNSKYGNYDIEAYEGFNVGVGYVGSKREGWTVDLMYLDTSKAVKELKKTRNSKIASNNGNVKLSFGYRFGQKKNSNTRIE